MREKSRVLILILFGAVLAGCANPLNRVTSDRYADECATAEQANDLCLAEQLCYRALMNVHWGNLGPKLKSQRQYNFGRIKRRLSRFSEAEEIFKMALEIEETLTGPDSIQIARRLAELAASLAAQDKWQEAIPYVERLATIDADYIEGERRFLNLLFLQFSERARSLNKADLAEVLEAKAKEFSR